VGVRAAIEDLRRQRLSDGDDSDIRLLTQGKTQPEGTVRGEIADQDFGQRLLIVASRGGGGSPGLHKRNAAVAIGRSLKSARKVGETAPGRSRILRDITARARAEPLVFAMDKDLPGCLARCTTLMGLPPPLPNSGNGLS
jgi:hypothetical protein